MDIIEIKQKIKSGELILDGKKLYTREEWQQIKEAKFQEEHYDLLQLTKKISMNSLYGALLNVAFRFGDERMGASVTGSGRGITTFMLETIEEVITGLRKKFIKVKGKPKKGVVDSSSWHYITHEAQLEKLRAEKKLFNPMEKLPEWFVNFESVIYGDTDSGYFKLPAENKEQAIEIADLTAEAINNAFPSFVQSAFLCQPGFDELIKCGREIVGERGLFQAKKKYIIKVVDSEGKAVDKLKFMGSEIKKSDTPKVIQKFLKATTKMILDGDKYDAIVEYVNSQRIEIIKKNKLNIFSLGVAKQVNQIDSFLAEYLAPGTQKYQDANGKWRTLTIPGHVKAALNYNTLLQEFDKGEKEISSGDKVVIFYVKPNAYNFDAIGFPAEFSKFPKWFSETFNVDVKKTETKMFDNKLEGIFSAWGKDVPSPSSILKNKLLSF